MLLRHSLLFFPFKNITHKLSSRKIMILQNNNKLLPLKIYKLKVIIYTSILVSSHVFYISNYLDLFYI